MTSFYLALVRRLFFFFAGLALGLPCTIGLVFALRSSAWPTFRPPTSPMAEWMSPAFEVVTRGPIFAALVCIALAVSCITIVTYVEYRHPLSPSAS